MPALAFDFDRTRRSRAAHANREPHGDAAGRRGGAARASTSSCAASRSSAGPAGAAAAARRSHARSHARRSADRVRQGDAERPLSAARRELPGHVRARLLRLCRRRRACPAALRLHVAAVVHAGDAGPVEWRHRRAACRSPASSTRCRTRSTASSSTWNENVWLASNGGGIGTYWGKVRSIGEKVKGGKTSGIIPFIHVMDGLTLAISQGSLRRGSAAVYLDIHHPEIEEFLEIRKASGDFNRKGLNLHHGINITDEFMEAVRDGTMFALRSPKTSEVMREVDARQLWQRILETRLQTGEPYILFIDAVNRALPQAPARARAEGHRPPTCAARSRCRPASTIAARSAPRCAACPRSTSRPGTSGTRSRASSRTCCASSTMC